MSDLHSIVKMGDPTSSNVVLLHGFAGYAEVWQPVIDDLGREHTCRAYDLPGHGRSLHHSAIGGAGRMAKAVAEDLQAKGSDIVHLVGHSMGGAVATLVALRIPELVASVTLLAPGGFGPEINHRLLARFAQAQGEEELRAILENMFGWNKNVPAGMLNAMIERRTIPGSLEKLQSIHETMCVEPGVQGMIPRRDLASLPMPVKVLWGTQDRVLPTRQAHKLPPQFAAHVIEDTGHMLIEECHDLVVRLIAENVRAGAS